MPYFTQVRMRSNCDTGISGIVGCLGLTGVSTAAPRVGTAGENRQDARCARRLLAQREGFWSRFSRGLWFRSEELLGGLARIRDPLAIMIAKVRPWR